MNSALENKRMKAKKKEYKDMYDRCNNKRKSVYYWMYTGIELQDSLDIINRELVGILGNKKL